MKKVALFFLETTFVSARTSDDVSHLSSFQRKRENFPETLVTKSAIKL